MQRLTFLIVLFGFVFAANSVLAADTYNVTIFEHGKTTFGSPQKERKGKLIVYNNNEIEFQIRAMKIVHKIKLKGPDFKFSNKYGEGRVDIVFEDTRRVLERTKDFFNFFKIYARNDFKY